MQKEYREFVKVVENHAGGTFRTAFSYNEDDWTTLYVRDDVATEELQNVVETLLAKAKQDDPIIHDDHYEKLGEYQATVEVYNRGVLLHFRETEETGVVISLDREAATDLVEFIQRCLSSLQT